MMYGKIEKLTTGSMIPARQSQLILLGRVVAQEHSGRHTPRMRGIQYAAASPYHPLPPAHTGSPAFAGDDGWEGDRCLSFVIASEAKQSMAQ